MLNKSYPNKDDIQKAKNANLIELIKRSGEEVVKSGPDEYCLASHDSFKISHNKWCWHSRDKIGGSCIDFAMHYPEKNTRSFNDAVYHVLDVMYGRQASYPEPSGNLHNVSSEYMADKDLILPKKFFNNNRVVAYLNKTRGIDMDIICMMIRNKKLYESSEGHNCVFVGYDKDGTARYGFNRGTFSDKKYARDCPGSSKDFGFVMDGFNDRVYVFESPIDAMSHATMFKINDDPFCQDNRISLGGVAGNCLIRYLQDNPKIKRIVFCLDNDDTGRNATIRLRHQLSTDFKDRQFQIDTVVPKKKDFNEELLTFFNRQIQNGRMM